MDLKDASQKKTKQKLTKSTKTFLRTMKKLLHKKIASEYKAHL